MNPLLRRFGVIGTRVGRRYLVLFLVAALVPALLLSVTGGWYVRSMLEEQARDGLSRLAKSVSLSLLVALTNASRDVRAVVRQPGGLSPADQRLGLSTELMVISGRDWTPRLTTDELAQLSADRVLLKVRPKVGNSEILLGIASAGTSSGEDTRWFTVNPQVFWTPLSEVVGGEDATMCVFEEGHWTRVRCSDDVTPEAEDVAREVARGTTESSGITTAGNWVVAHRDVFLRYNLGANSWRLVTLKSRERVMASASGFTTTAGLLLFTALVLVFVLSHVQIRRSTVPLQQLRDASTRVAEGHLDVRVPVRGNDEYSEVGEAFNGMTTALQQQVKLLHGMEAIDRSVLANRQIGLLVETALAQLGETHDRGSVALLVLRAHPRDAADIWWREARGRVTQHGELTLPAGERAELIASTTALCVAGDDAREFVQRSRGGASRIPSLVLPLRHGSQLLGAVSLHNWHDGTADRGPRTVQRLTERIALALANVQLVDQLDELSVGTLSAFARTIETNSFWSGGHAERVTAVAMALGRTLGVSDEEVAFLHRGGLLHDIGKIGIPRSVLDKAGPLDAGEWVLMRQHPGLGERILQPIPAFADVLPIVRSHHERFDGSGCPDGLAGEAIHPLARIVSVADVFDALVWYRPYRPANSPAAAVDQIVSSKGEFDPRVVEAFSQLVREDLLKALPTRRNLLPHLYGVDLLPGLPVA